MTKTTCDICDKKMPTAKFVDNIEELPFCVSSNVPDINDGKLSEILIGSESEGV